MDRQSVTDRLKKLVVSALNLRDVTPEQLAEDADLILDHGMNSIEALELLLQVEREFDIEIDDDDLTADLVRSVRNIADYLEQQSA